MQDLLFRNQKTLDKAFDQLHYREYGESLGFDVARFEECLPLEGKAEVARQQANATALGLLATPTFVIGRMRPDGKLDATDVLQGFQSVDGFAKVFDRLSTGSPWYLSPVGMAAGGLTVVLVTLATAGWRRRLKSRGPQPA